MSIQNILMIFTSAPSLMHHTPHDQLKRNEGSSDHMYSNSFSWNALYIIAKKCHRLLQKLHGWLCPCAAHRLVNDSHARFSGTRTTHGHQTPLSLLIEGCGPRDYKCIQLYTRAARTWPAYTTYIQYHDIVLIYRHCR